MLSDPEAALAIQPSNEPSWVADVIWWQVYPLGFVGAFPTPDDGESATPEQHRLLRLTAWLDHAVELGATGLSLGPIFDSVTHGYDTTDFSRIDPRLGTDEDFEELVGQAHARGLKVLLDGVFNHVGPRFPRYLDALADPKSIAAQWFNVADIDGKAVFKDFEGHGGLIALNHANPEVEDFVVGVMTDWLDRGADGWRLDAAYSMPTSFWAKVLPRVRESHPDVWIVGEVIHGDYSAIVAESTMDSVTQYELWKATWSSFNDGNMFELEWSHKRHNEFLETFAPMTFIGNHDVTRIASQLEDSRHLPLALVVLMTSGGTPSIYAGDEFALPGIKEERAGGDDAIRPEFPAAGPELLANASDDAEEIMCLHHNLIELRRRNPWLHRALSETVVLTNTFYAYEVSDGTSSMTIALNIGDNAVSMPCAGPLLAGSHAVTQRDESWTIPGHGWAVVGQLEGGQAA